MGNITFLGVEGSGKTVLTMALVNAFKAHEHEGWFLRPETLGAYRFIAQVPAELKEGTLPHQTTSLRHLAWSVMKDGNEVRQLDVLDYPGEIYRLAFTDAKDSTNPVDFLERAKAYKEEVDSLLGHLLESDHTFVLFNLSDARDLATNNRNIDAVWVTNACLDYLHRLPRKPRITLLLTQIDKYANLEQAFDPKAYLAQYLSLIAHNFPTLDVWAVSALGAAGEDYSINSIFVRCLADTTVVKDALGYVKKCRCDLEHVFSMNVLSEDFCDCAENTIAKLSCDASHWQRKLPWFINVKNLIASIGVLSSEASQECKTIVNKYRIALKECRGETLDYSKLLSVMSETKANSKEANQLAQMMCLQLQSAALKAQEAAEAARLHARKVAEAAALKARRAAKLIKFKYYVSRAFLALSIIALIVISLVIIVCA